MTAVVTDPHESDGHTHETHGHRKTESKGISFIYKIQFRLSLGVFSDNCGVSVSHNFEVHETHGHKTSSEHGERRAEEEEHREGKPDKRGIAFIYSGEDVAVDNADYLWGN